MKIDKNFDLWGLCQFNPWGSVSIAEISVRRLAIIIQIHSRSQTRLCRQRCLPDSPKPDSPKLGFRVRVYGLWLSVRVRV